MSSFVFLVGFSGALAGPAQDLAAEFLPGESRPAFGIACAPLRDTVQFGDALGTFADGAGPPELQMLLEAARDPEVETVDGIDVDGGFVMVAGPAGATAILPVRGSIEDAMGVFLNDSEDPAEWMVDGSTAVSQDASGARRTLSVDGTHARLVVSKDAASDTPGGQVPPPALTSLPDGSGCALWLQPRAGDPSTPPLLRNPIAAWIPFESGAPLRLHVQLPPHRDRKAVPAVVPPLSIVGPRRPQAVVTLGVPVLSILRDPVVQDSLPPVVRAGLPEGGIVDELGAGLVVGTFASSSGLVLVGVVPIQTESGRPVSARRIWRITSDAVVQAQKQRRGQVPVRLGRRSLEVQVTPRQAITLVAKRGRVVVGNARSEVEAVAGGEGVPWLNATQAAWASKHALAVFGEAPLEGLGMPLDIQVGAGARGDVFQLEILMDPGLQDPRVAEALRVLTAARKEGDGASVPAPPKP